MSNQSQFSFRNTAVVSPGEESQNGEVLLICSASFENRCFYVANQLTSDYKADLVLLCIFRGDYELKSMHEENLVQLMSRTNLHAKSSESQTLKTYDARGTINELNRHLADIAANHTITQVDFDVTTFTKQYILVLLNLLDLHFSSACIRILYTPASQYGSPKHRRSLSKHVRGIVAVPGFDMFRDSTDISWNLVAFLGFEEERVLKLLDALSPKCCIPVLQLRRNTHFGSRVPFDTNRRLLQIIRSRFGQEPQYIDAENPISTATFLHDVYKRTSEQGYSLLIAPHGSKMQAVGTYLFYRETNDPLSIGIIYALPQRYDRRQYSGDPIGYIAEFTWHAKARRRSIDTPIPQHGADPAIVLV